MSGKGRRLDILLEEDGFFPSRQIARTAIMDGAVLVNGQKITKPGTHIKEGAKIELTNQAQKPRYVSRGGQKLEKALSEFKIDPTGAICLDVGASTGGFTDCLLQHGAAFVYAVDVGYGQLAWSLRTDARVKVFERWNARTLEPEKLIEGTDKGLPSIAVIDVSFISIAKILPALITCLAEESRLIALVKPQFEAGRDQIGKGGVVRSPDVHATVICQIIKTAQDLQLTSTALTFSPIKGPEGNIEFLLLMEPGKSNGLSEDEVRSIVTSSHAELSAGK